MELTQINSSTLPNINDIQSNRSSSINNVQDSSINKPLEVDKIETNSRTQSSFSVNLVNNISKISELRSSQVEVSNQIQIANKIETLTNDTIKSGKPLDDIQPQIQSIMQTFNTSSKNVSDVAAKIDKENEDKKSRMYFDGILGAKPLSGKEILEAANAQKQRLAQFNEKIEQEVINTVNESKQIISNEKNLNEDKAVFKNIDFETESSEFKAEKVTTQEGSMFSTQANAEPAQNIKLLAS